jgi:hypothetical protein
VEPAEEHQSPIAVGVPTLTLIGTLGNDPAANQTYPPMYAASGNVFALPDPTAALPATFDGGAYFLEISYGDGSSERALIAVPEVVDTAMRLYAVNLDATRSPTEVSLYIADAPYPSLDPSEATLLHTRTLDPAPEPLPPVVAVGRGALANRGLHLRDRCEPGINCVLRRQESTWRGSASVSFGGVGLPEPAVCETPGEHTALTVPVVEVDSGATASLEIHAQRVVDSGADEVAVPLHDTTSWFAAADISQALRVWIPYEPNSTLGAGRWVADPAYALDVWIDGEAAGTAPLRVDLEVLAPAAVDLGTEFVSTGLTTPDSSMYFLVRDPSVGPTDRVWWGGGGPTVLRVPVVDSLGVAATLRVDAWQESCGSRWDMHAGRGAGNCTHALVLQVAATGNDDLIAGETYATPPSAPLVVDGRRWHDPGARELIGTFALEISYSP